MISLRTIAPCENTFAAMATCEAGNVSNGENVREAIEAGCDRRELAVAVLNIGMALDVEEPL